MTHAQSSFRFYVACIAVVSVSAGSSSGQSRPAGSTVAGAPYYTDSPLFSGNTAAPWMALRLSPRVPVADIATASANSSIAWNPTGSTYAPMVNVSTKQSAPGQIATSSLGVQPAKVGTASTQPVPSVPRQSSAEPFVDYAAFTPTGQEWREYDIAPYTSRFHTSAKPEQAVRDWILSETRPDVWHGMDVAALSVTPQRVRAYHTPQVLEQIEGLLGQLLYYAPGRFPCRVYLWLVTDSNWRHESGVPTEPAHPTGAAWLVSASDVPKLVDHLTRRDRAILLANPQFDVANGQYADVNWENSATTGSNESASRTRDLDQVTIRFSALIAPDAATTLLRMRGAVRAAGGTRDVLLDAPSRALAAGSDRTEIPGQSISISPHKRLVVSLGQLAAAANESRLFASRKYRELVVLLDMAPDPSNTVNGSPVIIPAGNATSRSAQPSLGDQTERNLQPARSKSARPATSDLPPPPTSSRPVRASQSNNSLRGQFPPEELTRPVY